jgi:HEAT repeat protein
MKKSDPIETALNRLGELRSVEPDVAKEELRTYLGNRSNLVAAKAAKIAGELRISELIPDLAAAFNRFMKNPQQLDKRCAAITEIAGALYEMDYREPEIYLRGLRHIQREASFGPPVDTAAALRGMCAQGLVRTSYANALAEVVQLLVDSEPPARLGAIRALASNGGDAGGLLLRLKVLTGDNEPEVLGECFAGLLAAAPERTIGFVARYVDDEDETTSEAAIWALGESRLPAGFEVLQEKWQRTVGRSSRKVLLAAMAASRLQESIDFLRSLLESTGSQTASDVLVALAIYKGNKSVKESVAAIVRRRGDKALIEMFEHHFEV